ncbi:Uncharacterised protein [Candidatus Tiddalikarchaeum anstoanum]|nr:Uncharacterised protein [Candidatus Tiddalikarchaeum anstoanum]
MPVHAQSMRRIKVLEAIYTAGTTNPFEFNVSKITLPTLELVNKLLTITVIIFSMLYQLRFIMNIIGIDSRKNLSRNMNSSFFVFFSGCFNDFFSVLPADSFDIF